MLVWIWLLNFCTISVVPVLHRFLTFHIYSHNNKISKKMKEKNSKLTLRKLYWTWAIMSKCWRQTHVSKIYTDHTSRIHFSGVGDRGIERGRRRKKREEQLRKQVFCMTVFLLCRTRRSCLLLRMFYVVKLYEIRKRHTQFHRTHPTHTAKEH